MDEKKLEKEQLAKLIDDCTEVWHKIDRIEIVVKDLTTDIEGVIKSCRTHMKEVQATLFLDDDEKGAKK